MGGRGDGYRAGSATDRLLAGTLADGSATALSCRVVVGGRPVYQRHLGLARAYAYDPATRALGPAPNAEALDAQHLFDVASLTKVVATAAMVATLVEAGRLTLDTSVHDRLALPRTANARPIAVRDLLAHRAGLAPWAPLYFDVRTRAELLAALGPYVARAQVGTGYAYSDLGYLLLGALVEQAAEEPLDAYFARRLAEPLQLARATYAPTRRRDVRAVATGHANVYERRMIDEPNFGLRLPDAWPARPSAAFAGWRERTLEGEVDDGNAHHAMGGVAGHAGLFADAEAVSTLAEALAGPAHGAPARALGVRPEVRAQLLAPLPSGAHMAWRAARALPTQGLPEDCVMMRGFTGCFVASCPSRATSIAVLGNREHPRADGVYADLGPLFGAVAAVWLTGSPAPTSPKRGP